MTRALSIAAFMCFSLHAQFDDIVTTDDGSVLLFNSRWRLAGSGDADLLKIFRWDAKGFTVVYSPSNPGFISPPFAFNPLLAGDGKVSGYVSYPGCSGSGCSSVKSTLVLNGATVPAALPSGGTIQLSRNGRFLAAGSTVVDLSTGATRTAAGGFPEAGQFGIGNNGGLLMLTVHQAFIVSNVDLTLSSRPGVLIVNAPEVLDAVVSAVENRVVYEIWGDTAATRDQLWSYDVASGQSTKLADIALGTALGISQFQPSISNDGSRLLYRLARADGSGFDAVIQDFNTGSTTPIAQILPSSANLVISGDGKSAWVHRFDGRLVRIAIDSLQATEIPGRHAWMVEQDGAEVSGSYHHLYGGAFAPDNTSGPPADLTVNLAGLSLPLLAANTSELDVQIPWEATSFGQYPMVLHNASSPFESVLTLNLEPATPTFERTGMPRDGQRNIIVAHQDFHGLVTHADPALPGEFVHAYMTGLGGTQPQPPTGSVPTNLSSAMRPLCWLVPPARPQETTAVTFAGLAPGLIGIYQVDIAIPADFAASEAQLSCVDQVGAGELNGDSGTMFIGKR